MITLTSMVSREGWQTTIGNARSFAASLQDVRASIEIDATHPLGQVNKLLHGSYVMAPGRGNGILDPDHQFNPDALQLIQEMQPSILRFGEQPIFEDGIGDPQSRPPARCGWEDPCTGEWEHWRTYEYGMDEHMALLEAIGAEGQALICVGYPEALEDSTDPNSCVISSINSNLSQMVKRAMAWVAYVNGDPADTTLIGVDDHGFDWQTVGYWAQQRVNNGHPEPYGVKYWEIGSEVYWGDVSPEKYGQDYLVFQDAMKRVDPSIVVGASARIESYAYPSWNIPLLSVIGPTVDALVLQPYYPREIYDPIVQPAVMAAATQADDDLAQMRQLLATTTDRADEISLILNEMGINYILRCEPEPTIPIAWNMLLVGVYDADLIGMLVERSADYRLELGIQHWLHGAAPQCDIHFDWGTGERYKRPDYYALQLWTNHFGDVLVQNAVTCDTFDVPETYGNVGPLYDVPYLAAHTSIAEDKLYLLVINRHLTDDITTAIHINGFFPQPNAAVYTLNGPDVESTNEYGSHDTIVIASSSISDASHDFSYVFPAHSVTVIEFSMTAHPVGPFTTTGYNTILPHDWELLPSGRAKFHLTAQGGVTEYFEGTFTFEEWGIVDLGGRGTNHGIMTITTDDGEAVIRFGGQANLATDPSSVGGSFTVLDGNGAYKGLKGQGMFDGDAELTFTVDYTPLRNTVRTTASFRFTVDYTPCGKKDGTPCPACAASGGDLKLNKKEAKWKLTNNGDDTITISSITVWWPGSSGQLKKVKLGGETIYDQALCSTSLVFPSSCWATINSGWEGKDKDRQIGKGKTRELKFEFEHEGSTDASDYTILVEFAEGCAATAVAFPPAP